MRLLALLPWELFAVVSGLCCEGRFCKVLGTLECVSLLHEATVLLSRVGALD